MAQALTHHEVTEGWLADLTLAFENVGGRTELTQNRHTGPLRLQRLLHPEKGACHAYILHPPGGVVGGDRLVLHAAVKSSGAALMTTPGATKFYRSCGPVASQEQHIRVEEHGSVEWFPQENIIYPGANAKILTRIDLEESSEYMGWDILCLGMPACNQAFSSGHLDAVMDIRRQGQRLFLDRLCVAGGKGMARPAGMRGFSVCATFTAVNVTPDMVDELRGMMAVKPGGFGGLTLMDDLLVARYLGHSSTEAKNIFQGLWAWLRPAISGRDACVPRIWAT